MRKIIINTFNVNSDRRIDRRFMKLIVLSSPNPKITDIPGEDTIGLYFDQSNNMINTYWKEGNTVKSKLFPATELPEIATLLLSTQPGIIIDNIKTVDFLAAKMGLLGDFILPFSDLSYEKRFPLNAALIQYIHTQSVETLHGIHELSNAALPLYEDLLKKMGLKTLSAKYAPDHGAFNFLFGYNQEIYEAITTVQFHYTQYETENGIQSGKGTPEEVRNSLTKEEKLKRHLGTEFEKSAQLIWLKKKDTNEIVLIVQTHPGLEMAHRIAAMQLLCDALRNNGEKLREWMPNECKNVPPSWSMTIISGDLNLFDATIKTPTEYADQIAILTNNDYKWVSEGLSHVGLKATFVSLLFDILRFLTKEEMAELKLLIQDVKENKKDPHELRLWFVRIVQEKDIRLFSCCLDGVFIRGLPKNATVSVNAYFSTPVNAFSLFGYPLNAVNINDARALQNSFVKHYQDHPASDSAEPPLGSDHASLRTEICYEDDSSQHESLAMR